MPDKRYTCMAGTGWPEKWADSFGMKDTIVWPIIDTHTAKLDSVNACWMPENWTCVAFDSKVQEHIAETLNRRWEDEENKARMGPLVG